MNDDTKQCLIFCSAATIILCTLFVSVASYYYGITATAMEQGYTQTALPGSNTVIWTKEEITKE